METKESNSEDPCLEGHIIVVCANKSMCCLEDKKQLSCNYCLSTIKVTEQHCHCNICFDGILCLQCGTVPMHPSLKIKTKEQMDNYLVGQFAKVEPLMLQAGTFAAGKEWAKAEEAVTSLIDMGFNSSYLPPFLFYFRAKAYAEQGKKLQSLADMTRAKYIQSYYQSSFQSIIGVHVNVSNSPNYKDAILLCKIAIKQATVDKCPSPLQAAKEAYLNKKWDVACSYFRRSKVIFPTQRLTGQFYDAFLVCLSNLSFNAEALLELENIPEKELCPADLAHLYAWRSKLYWECAFDEESLQSAKKSLSIKENDKAYISLGNCQVAAGKLKEGFNSYITAFVLNPKSWIAALECYAVCNNIPEERDQCRIWMIIAMNLNPQVNVIEFVNKRSLRGLFWKPQQDTENLPTQLFTKQDT